MEHLAATTCNIFPTLPHTRCYSCAFDLADILPVYSPTLTTWLLFVITQDVPACAFFSWFFPGRQTLFLTGHLHPTPLHITIASCRPSTSTPAFTQTLPTPAPGLLLDTYTFRSQPVLHAIPSQTTLLLDRHYNVLLTFYSYPFIPPVMGFKVLQFLGGGQTYHLFCLFLDIFENFSRQAGVWALFLFY